MNGWATRVSLSWVDFQEVEAGSPTNGKFWVDVGGRWDYASCRALISEWVGVGSQKKQLK